MESKSRDEKIFITDVAVEKVGRTEIPGFTPSLNDELYRHHKELLTKAMNENDSNEVLRIWDINTGKFVDTLGDRTHVKPNKNPKVSAFVSEVKLLSLGYLHNHPTTSNFSLADIKTFIDDDDFIKLITVVTNQGEVYYLYKTDKYDPLTAVRLYNEVVDKLGGAGTEVNDEFAKEFVKICRKGGIIYGKK